MRLMKTTFDIGKVLSTVKALSGSPQSVTTEGVPGLDEPVILDLGNGLAVAYLVDVDDGFAWVQARHLPLVSDNRELLDRVGRANLKRLAAERLQVNQYGEHVFGIVLDGHFEASLILLDDLWDESLARLVPNGAVAALPTRDVLAFCDAGSVQGIEELWKLVANKGGACWECVQIDLTRREAAVSGDSIECPFSIQAKNHYHRPIAMLVE